MLRNGHINRYSRMCMLDHEFERHSHVVNLLNDVIGFCNTSLRTELRLQKPCAKLLAQQSRSLEFLAGESSGCQGSHGILGSRQKQQNQLNIGSTRSIFNAKVLDTQRVNPIWHQNGQQLWLCFRMFKGSTNPSTSRSKYSSRNKQQT